MFGKGNDPSRAFLHQDGFKGLPGVLQAQAAQVPLRGRGRLMTQDGLDDGHRLPGMIEGRGGQVPDGMEAKRLDPSAPTEALHEVLTLFKGFAIVVTGKGRIVEADEHMGRFLDRASFPPTPEGLPKLAGHGDPVELQGAITTFAGAQPDAAIGKVHVGPGQLEDLRTSGGQMEVGEEHDLVLPLRYFVDRPEVVLGRHIPGVALFSETIDLDEGIGREIVKLHRPIPGRNEVLPVLVGSVATSGLGLFLQIGQGVLRGQCFNVDVRRHHREEALEGVPLFAEGLEAELRFGVGKIPIRPITQRYRRGRVGVLVHQRPCFGFPVQGFGLGVEEFLQALSVFLDAGEPAWFPALDYFRGHRDAPVLGFQRT